MAIDSESAGRSDDRPADEFTDFLSLLNELKATGCTLLVVGDVRRELFTRASASLFGSPETLRYRLLAVTDASSRSVERRLPDPDDSPFALARTTKIANYEVTPRSVAEAVPRIEEFDDIPETRVTDAELGDLQSALVSGIDEFARRASGLRPAELRVGVDSVGALLDHHGEEVVRECCRAVGRRVRDNDGMAHYVLRDAHDSDRVRALEYEVDAVIEIRATDPATDGHDAEQRWHVPDRETTTNWVRL